LQSLRATQRGWIKGRDECWKADGLRDCVKSAYLTREAELVALWMFEEPSSVVSYSCGDNPVKEVTAFFFDTELPGIRLEYGDSIRSGWLVPAASGSKYATPFGGMFWTKGDNALFAWTEGDEISCKISG
jgi:membrane-bound inhibitor of C-type lysozyme